MEEETCQGDRASRDGEETQKQPAQGRGREQGGSGCWVPRGKQGGVKTVSNTLGSERKERWWLEGDHYKTPVKSKYAGYFRESKEHCSWEMSLFQDQQGRRAGESGGGGGQGGRTPVEVHLCPGKHPQMVQVDPHQGARGRDRRLPTPSDLLQTRLLHAQHFPGRAQNLAPGDLQLGVEKGWRTEWPPKGPLLPASSPAQRLCDPVEYFVPFEVDSLPPWFWFLGLLRKKRASCPSLGFMLAGGLWPWAPSGKVS